MKLKSAALVLLNKPAGITSFDCIRKLKKILRRTDIGHGGTLDLFATGLLPIFIGEGLKLSRFFTENHPELPTHWKTYEGILQFGASTDTGEYTGTVINQSKVIPNDVNEIQMKMKHFTNSDYLQTPPKYSAKKIDGVRASDRVRNGEEINLKPVLVKIKEFECIELNQNEMRFLCSCSKGTYIRTLVEDLANQLNTFAHLKSLNRLNIGGFNLKNSLTFEEIENEVNGLNLGVYSLAEAISFIPKIEITDTESKELKQGRQLNTQARLLNSGNPSGIYSIWNQETNQPIAIFKIKKNGRDSECKMLRGFNS